MIKKIIIICLILFVILCFLVLFCFLRKTPIKNADYYYKNNNQYICFRHLNNCYTTESTEKSIINGKLFVGLGMGEHLYDTSSYKYNKKTDTYTVDMLLDRDNSTDLGSYTSCPYDDGLITHILFEITYIPSKKVFKAKYKGFLSSKEVITYDKYGNLSTYHLQHLNIYYTTDTYFISELNKTLNKLNKEVIKTFEDPNGYTYWLEIIYLLKNYI